jgi:hypothetical protein
MRATVRLQQLEGEIRWRICEQSGELVDKWLPDEEAGGPLDRGGFLKLHDAQGFRLGVDWVRAEAGVLGDMNTDDIDRERALLDNVQVGRPPGAQRRCEMPQYVAA